MNYDIEEIEEKVLNVEKQTGNKNVQCFTVGEVRFLLDIIIKIRRVTEEIPHIKEREFNKLAGSCPECGGEYPCNEHK